MLKCLLRVLVEEYMAVAMLGAMIAENVGINDLMSEEGKRNEYLCGKFVAPDNRG